MRPSGKVVQVLKPYTLRYAIVVFPRVAVVKATRIAMVAA